MFDTDIRAARVAMASACAWVAAASGPASGGADAALWNFDETTTGQDVFWSSPTSVNPIAALYVSAYELTLVEVDVTWLGLPFNNIDVTEQVPPDLRAGSGADPGPAPLELFNAPIVFPEPPAPTCLSALLLISLDAAGFGQLAGTDIVLGNCDVDIGFGTVTVQLQSVRLVGTVSIDALTCPWDLDADGNVGITDFLSLLAGWGTFPIGPPDFDGDGIVGISDFLAMLANWGLCPE
ncbi:MAG: hypothetical protein ACYS0G_15615 [Planctomycetota bacterium]|jgi:hypothetical protein